MKYNETIRNTVIFDRVLDFVCLSVLTFIVSSFSVYAILLKILSKLLKCKLRYS